MRSGEDENSPGAKGIQRTRGLPDANLGLLWDSIIVDERLKTRLLSFDDVVVKYDPPIAGAGPDRVSADYHQFKWHVQTGGRFGYEELARQLKVRRLNVLNRVTLLEICTEEGLLAVGEPEPDGFLPIAIRSFLGPAADLVGVAPEDTLVLAGDFRAADAHASIAFLAGAVLHLKSGVRQNWCKKGVSGQVTWRAEDGSGSNGGRFEIEEDRVGRGREIANRGATRIFWQGRATIAMLVFRQV